MYCTLKHKAFMSKSPALSEVSLFANLFLLRRTTLQSFSYPPLSFSMPVWTMCPTGTSRSLAHKRCSSRRA